MVSPIYKDREIARIALNKLPTNVRSQGLWLKDVAAAKAELSSYIESQTNDTSSFTLN